MLVVALKFQAYVTEWGADPRKRPVYFLRESLSELQTRIMGMELTWHNRGHPRYHQIPVHACSI